APLTPGFAPAKVELADEVRDGVPQPPSRPPPLTKQIEALFSNEALSQDAVLRELVVESPGGWVDLEAVLQLKRIRALRAKREDVLRALRDSKFLETWRDPDGSAAAVRRPPSRGPPPPLALTPPTRPVSGAPPGQGSASRPTSRSDAGISTKAEPRDTEQQKLLLPGRLRGQVASYDEESGDAAISCSQVDVLFGCHVTVDWRELERAGAAVAIGSSVSFLVELGPAGEPRARELQLGAEEEVGDFQPPRKRSKGATATEAVAGAKGRKAVVGNRYSGTVRISDA
ncbi:unnamed protein product, partial [Polarella glacialis]